MKPAWALAARTGPVREYVSLKVFACEGLICIIDERPGKTEGEYTIVTPLDLEERVRELNRKYRNKGRMDMPFWKRFEHDKEVRGSQNCTECIKEARAMGDPSDPAVQLFWARHRRSSTVRFNFSPRTDAKGYPSLPIVPLGKMTGRTAEIGAELALPALTVRDDMHIHVPPKPKNRSGLILLD